LLNWCILIRNEFESARSFHAELGDKLVKLVFRRLKLLTPLRNYEKLKILRQPAREVLLDKLNNLELIKILQIITS
jgi:hypothetical protein